MKNGRVAIYSTCMDSRQQNAAAKIFVGGIDSPSGVCQWRIVSVAICSFVDSRCVSGVTKGKKKKEDNF